MASDWYLAHFVKQIDEYHEHNGPKVTLNNSCIKLWMNKNIFET